MKLRINFTDFVEKIDFFLSTAKPIVNIQPKTKAQLNDQIKLIEIWTKGCEQFLEESFELNPTEESCKLPR